MALDKKVSYSGQNKVDTLSSKVRIEEGKGRLVAFDGSNNVGLFGYDDAGQVVVKVAKPGFDANSATDEQLIFNSNQNIFKIHSIGTATIPSVSLSSGQATATMIPIPIPEEIVGVPVVNAYVLVTDWFWDSLTPTLITGYQPLPYSPMFPPEDINTYNIKTIVNSDFLYISAYFRTSFPGSGYTFPATDVKYYIMQETQN